MEKPQKSMEKPKKARKTLKKARKNLMGSHIVYIHSLVFSP